MPQTLLGEITVLPRQVIKLWEARGA